MGLLGSYEMPEQTTNARSGMSTLDRADAIEGLIQESIRVKQQFLNIQQMKYENESSKLEDDYTDEDDEEEAFEADEKK